MRQIARESGVHPSTIHRQIRIIEAQREDLLVDSALNALSRGTAAQTSTKGHQIMNAPLRQNELNAGLDAFQAEALRVLRRLVEPGACLAYAKDMEKAVVVRESADGGSIRTAVTEREVAQKMALQDWLVCRSPGRVSRYHVTSAGRAALKRMLAEAGPMADETQDAFGEQHREWGARCSGRR
jgi:hypothetical protein